MSEVGVLIGIGMLIASVYAMAYLWGLPAHWWVGPTEGVSVLFGAAGLLLIAGNSC